jgi:hypothetical protein
LDTLRRLVGRFFDLQWLGKHDDIAIKGMRNGPPFDLRYRLVAASWRDEAPNAPERVAEGRVGPNEGKHFAENWSWLFPAGTNRYGHPTIPLALADGPPQNATFTLVLHHGDYGGLRARGPKSSLAASLPGDPPASSSMAVWLNTATRDANKERALTSADRWEWIASRATEAWSLARGIGHPLDNALSGEGITDFDAGGSSPEALELARAKSSRDWSKAQMEAASTEVAEKAVTLFQKQTTQNSITRLSSRLGWEHWVFLWLVGAFFLPVAWFQFVSGARRRSVAVWRFALVLLAVAVCLAGYAWLWRFEPETSSYFPGAWAGYSACCYSLIAGLCAAAAVAMALWTMQGNASGASIQRRRRKQSFGVDILRWALPSAGSLAIATAAMIWWVNPVADDPLSVLGRILPDLPSASLLALSLWLAGTSCLLLPRSAQKFQT